MSTQSLLAAFAAAAMLSMFGTQAIAALFRRQRWTDAPDGDRKLQTDSVPLGGGIAVACSMGAVVLGAFSLGLLEWDEQSATFFGGFVPAMLVLLVVGLVDDFIGLTGVYKLLGQFLAAILLAVGGAQFEAISLFGAEFHLGDLTIPFAIFYCIGAINAFNLIDGSDAFASSIGAIVSLTMGLISLGQGNVSAALVSFALAGALLGFLRHNAPPASIYLGDTGSMLIGLVVAYVSITCSVKEQAVVAIAVPAALCTLPLLDAAAALLRRVLTGQSLFAADRGHFHHSLLLRGLSAAQAAAVASLLTAITCAGALASYLTGQEIWAVLAVLGVSVSLVSLRVFGYSELNLVLHHAGKRSRKLLRRTDLAKDTSHTHNAFQLQGSRSWQMVWEGLCERAGVFDIHNIRLTITIPRLHEHFYATWQNKNATCDRGEWSMTLPLEYDGRAIGTVQFGGCRGEVDHAGAMRDALELIESLESEVASLLARESDEPDLVLEHAVH